MTLLKAHQALIGYPNILNFFRPIFVLTLTSLFILGLFPAGPNSASACPTVRPQGDLVVALRNDAMPFTGFNDDGRATGFNVTLWKEIAETLRVPDGVGGLREPSVTLIECNKINDQEAGLVAGRIDVVISPLTITSRRMEKYDFSQQYISSGLSVAVPARNAINFDTASKIIKETLFSSTVAAAVIGFLSFNLVMAALIRWILFSPNDHHAGGRFGVWMRAILEALMRTIGLRGVDGEYKSALSKLFEIFMAVVGTALSATILGILTSAFVGSVGDQEEIKANKLVSMRVATLHCSTAQDLLHSQYVTFARALSLDNPATDLVNDRVSAMSCVRSDGDQSIPTFDPIPGINGEVHLVDSWPAAMELLAQGRVDAVLGDWVALTYLSRQGFGGKIDVLPNVYRNEPYGWGISRTSVNEEIRRDIDSALINNMRDVTWRRKLEGALGAGSVSPN